MTLIELDISTEWRPPETPRPVRPVRRWLAAGVVALFGLGLLVAGERPASLAPRLVVEGTGVQWALATTRDVFVLHQPNQGVTELAGYRLADGVLLWRRPFAATTSMLFANERSVVLSAATGQQTVVGLDPATGATRWERTGYDAGPSTEKAVVV